MEQTASVAPSPSLWRDPDFAKLWIGQAISEVGSRVSREGLPLTAVMVLHATPAQMGLLAALGGIATLVAGPIAGVAADRWRHRPILIAADLGRAALLAVVPLAAWQGWLSLGLLMAVVAGVGVLTIFFDVAYQSLLPVLVRRDQLLEGNAKLTMTASAAEVVGPGVTGFLVQALTAPRAILLDSLSFVVSALSIGWLREPQRPVDQAHPGHREEPGWREAAAGFRFVARHALLRPLALRTATASFCLGFFASLYVFYAVEILRLTPGVLGLVIAIGGASSFLGAAVAHRLPRRFAVGHILIGSSLLTGLSMLLIPLAHGSWLTAAAFLGAAQLFGDIAFPVYGIHEMTLRQSLAPPELLGRVNACMHLLFKGLLPVGALAGGFAAGAFGLRATMAASAGGVLLSTLWLVFSPVRTLRDHPVEGL